MTCFNSKRQKKKEEKKKEKEKDNTRNAVLVKAVYV